MITNQNEPDAARALDRCRAEIPASEAFLKALQGHPDPFECRPVGSGFDFASLREVDGRPNRAVVKVFTIPDGPMKGQAAAFFYKGSLVPFGRERFSYGVCIIPGADASPAEMKGWLDFAASGFDPDIRPPKLRRAFTFTVPD
jgi:hypothetical protein